MLPPLVARVVETLLSAKGMLDTALRRAVADRAAGLAATLPEPLAAWTDKVARHAYKTTDEEVAALKQAGYSEDQIFEATLAAAVGASLSRLERGLSLLRGAAK